MANEFVATERSEVLTEGVTVQTQGRALEGWENVRISTSIESIANTFSFNYDDRFTDGDLVWPLRPGNRVKILIGEDPILGGRVDKLDANFAASDRAVSVSGRSLCGDLIDCSVSSAKQYMDIAFEDFVSELIKPFGLSAFFSVVPDRLKNFAIKPGETVFTALDRAARLQGFFWISTREGNIRLTEAGRGRSQSGLFQDVNLLSGSVSIDNSERFSEYKVIGQSPGSDAFAGLGITSPEASAKDLGVTRFRPIVILAEGSVTADVAKKRAEWEASTRAAKGLKYTVTVQGWRQESGELWGINQIVRLKSDFLGVNGDLLIASVDYVKDNNQGTVCQLGLVRKDAFKKAPEIKEELSVLEKFLGQR